MQQNRESRSVVRRLPRKIQLRSRAVPPPVRKTWALRIRVASTRLSQAVPNHAHPCGQSVSIWVPWAGQMPGKPKRSRTDFGYRLKARVLRDPTAGQTQVGIRPEAVRLRV